MHVLPSSVQTVQNKSSKNIIIAKVDACAKVLKKLLRGGINWAGIEKKHFNFCHMDKPIKSLPREKRKSRSQC